MGFFSWKTADTDESVSNLYSIRGAHPCKMLSPDGRVFEETDYAGYGFFGGKDYYELVSELNGISEGDLSMEGIRLVHSGKPCILPKIVSLDCASSFDSLPDSPVCPLQGFFYDPEGDEE